VENRPFLGSSAGFASGVDLEKNSDGGAGGIHVAFIQPGGS
jgi:hypothetical protein